MDAITAPNSIADSNNPYADIFSDYIHRSLEESLNQVKAIRQMMPEERRIQICHILDYGLQLSSAWASVSELTVLASPFMERSGDWEDWEKILRRAVELAHKEEDTESEIALMILLAKLSQRQNRFKEVVTYYRWVIRTARLGGYHYEEARACSNLGYLFIETGRFLRSEVLCKHALGIFEEMQSEHGLAHTHNHLGLLFTRQRFYERAEIHLERACKIWIDLQDSHSLFLGYTNLGLLYYEVEQTKEALIYLDLALKQATKNGESVQIARTWNNLGLTQLREEDYIQAEKHFTNAMNIFEQFSDNIELAKVSNNLGLVHLGCGRYRQASTCFERALQISLQLKYASDFVDTQHSLGITYQFLGRWNEAIVLLKSAQKHFERNRNHIEEMKVLIALTNNATTPHVLLLNKLYITRLDELLLQHSEDSFQQLYFEYRKSYCARLSKQGNQTI